MRCASGTGTRSSNVGDVINGHGTHVAGSVAGSSTLSTASTTNQYTFSSAYNGAAPGAKIAFDDISIDGNSLEGLPDDVNTGLFPVSYWAGARIHSNSWGTTETWYTFTAMEMDMFTVCMRVCVCTVFMYMCTYVMCV